MSQSFYDHYVFEGTHTQAGLQHGEELRGQIGHHLKLIYDKAGTMSGLSRESSLSVASRFEPFVRKYAPGFMDELEGLARGAGISVAEALMLQARQEVLNLQRLGGAEPECTSYAVRPEYTAGGKMIAGQNADLTGDFEAFTNVITFKITGKPQVMMVTPAGQISYQGCSDAGLSVNCNFLVCNGWKAGFPRYLISRLAIEQPTFERARNVIENLERASSRNFLLCGKDGQIVDYETTSEDFEAIEVDGPFFVHSNHFLSERLAHLETSTDYELTNSKHRLERMRQLIEDNKGRIDSQKLKSFLRDHENGPHSICMHPDPPDNNAHSFTSSIINLTDGVMEICKGNPCHSEYAAYEFLY